MREEITRYETTQLVHRGCHLRGIQHLQQDISGDWQGSLKACPQDLRIILKITRADSREWKATMLSIDQSPDRTGSEGWELVGVRDAGGVALVYFKLAK